jgi:hypothetical protein
MLEEVPAPLARPIPGEWTLAAHRPTGLVLTRGPEHFWVDAGGSPMRLGRGPLLGSASGLVVVEDHPIRIYDPDTGRLHRVGRRWQSASSHGEGVWLVREHPLGEYVIARWSGQRPGRRLPIKESPPPDTRLQRAYADGLVFGALLNPHRPVALEEEGRCAVWRVTDEVACVGVEVDQLAARTVWLPGGWALTEDDDAWWVVGTGADEPQRVRRGLDPCKAPERLLHVAMTNVPHAMVACGRQSVWWTPFGRLQWELPAGTLDLQSGSSRVVAVEETEHPGPAEPGPSHATQWVDLDRYSIAKTPPLNPLTRALSSPFLAARHLEGHAELFVVDLIAGEYRAVSPPMDCPGRLVQKDRRGATFGIQCRVSGPESLDHHVWSEVVDLNAGTRWRSTDACVVGLLESGHTVLAEECTETGSTPERFWLAP